MEFLITSRRDRPGNDPIFALNAEAKARAAKGENVINATIGALLNDDGSLAVMPSVETAFSSLPSRTRAAYAPIAGRPDFRQAVIDDLLGPYGLADQACAVATPGGTGALRMAMDNFLEPGQAFITSSFFWGPYRTLASESGHQLETFNMFNGEGRLDVADLDRVLGESLRKQGRALVILNTPCHNPTGYSMDQAEWDEVVAVVARHGANYPITVLLDVAYAYYQPEGFKLCLQNLAKLTDHALVLFAWSASKSYLQYGLRVGSLVAISKDDKERERISNAMTFSCRGMWSNCNAGGMAAITQVLLDPELRKRAAEERGELAAMLLRRVECWNKLAGAAGLQFPRYDGGFFTTVFCKDPAAVAAQLRAKGIFLIPVSGALRVALCAVGEDRVAPIVEGLAEAV
jgi:aromatic-amino-acid transaminase